MVKSESRTTRRVRQLLSEVERYLEAKSDMARAIQLFPWLTVTNSHRFLDTVRNEGRSVEEGRGPIGYPVTTATCEDLVKKLARLAQVLSSDRKDSK